MASLSHRQGWSFAVLLSIFPCVFASSSNDFPPANYRTGTSEVRISFFATDENNHLVETLHHDDFAIVDNEMVIRDFRSLTRSEETALDIVVLLDASESVAPHFHEVAGDVLRLVSRTYHSPDTISIVTFAGTKPAVLCADDCNSSEIERQLLSIIPAGSTPLFDSLAFASRFISARRAAGVRQLVVVFSDGDDTISGTSPRDTLEALASTGALLYAVDIQRSGKDLKGRFWLQKMAEATGGRSFALGDGSANVLEEVLADLHASYVVTYPVPSHEVGFHSLRILPKHNLNLQFHCRRGYFYEENR